MSRLRLKGPTSTTNRRIAPRVGEPGETAMLKNFDELQKLGKDNMDIAMKTLGVTSKSVQAIAAEVADYSKKSFEEASAAAEKLLGAKSFEKAIEIQTDYAKTAYEGFVAGATRIGELYADLTKETYKPFESYLGKVNGAAK
jgi:hypothetical protein